MEMVKFERGRLHSGRGMIPPEKTSWKIRMKGMSVMALVVVREMLERKRLIISAA